MILQAVLYISGVALLVLAGCGFKAQRVSFGLLGAACLAAGWVEPVVAVAFR